MKLLLKKLILLTAILPGVAGFASEDTILQEPYIYEDTLWLIQLRPENRATIYEGRASRGGLTYMLNIIAKYVPVMEPTTGTYPKPAAELHFYSEAGRKVLYIGDSWIGDGEKIALMSPEDYKRMTFSSARQNNDSKVMLEWMERRNRFYEKRKKKQLKQVRAEASLDASSDLVPGEASNISAPLGKPIGETNTAPGASDMESTDNLSPRLLLEDNRSINELDEERGDLDGLQLNKNTSGPSPAYLIATPDNRGASNHSASAFLLSALGYAMAVLLAIISLVIYLGRSRK